MIEIPFDEQKIEAPQAPLRVEDIQGFFPQVTDTNLTVAGTGVPNWTPKTFRDQFAIYYNVTGPVYRLFVWDTAHSAWRKVTLT